MVQLKVMRRSIRDGIIAIEQQEKRALNDSVRNFFVRIKRLFMHKFKISYGDRRMTKKLLRLVREFSVEDVGMDLDQAMERKKAATAKKRKMTSTKLIVKDFVRRLKTFARRLEYGLRMTEEDERRKVRAMAQRASVQLQEKSAYKGLIDAHDKNVKSSQQLCKVWERLIQLTHIGL